MPCPLHTPVGALYGWPDWIPRLPSSAYQGRLYSMMTLPNCHPGPTAPQPDVADVAVQGRLYRSLKLWTFYCDLEESLGTLESARAVYDQILDLRIATPQIVLNYALFLEVRQGGVQRGTQSRSSVEEHAADCTVMA
jgi:hypothetical protein